MFRSKNVISFFLNLYGFLFLLAPVIHSLKIIRLSIEVGAYTFYVSTVIYFFLNLIFALNNYREILKIKMYFIDFLLVVMLLFGMAATLVFMGDIIDISGNFLRFATSLLIFWNFRILFSDPKISNYLNGKYLNKLSLYGLIGVIISLIVVYSTILGGNGVYLGLSTENIVPFIGQNIQYAPLKMIFGILLTVLGGKRGVILGVMLGSIFILILKNKKIFSFKKSVSFLLLIGPILIIGLSIQSDQFFDSLPRSLQRRVEPFRIDDTQSGTIDLSKATSGRNREVEAVFLQWRRDPLTIWTGKGFGAAFTLQHSDEQDSSVHISPIGVSFLVGIPLGLAFYAVLFFYFFKFKIQNREKQVWFFIFFFTVLNSFTVFSIFQNPLFWISFAALLSNTNEGSYILKKKALYAPISDD